MDQSFARFLRNGLHGEVNLTGARRVPPSRPIRLTLKRLFPDYDAHRSAFEANLDQVIAENTAMLLGALNPPDSPPNVSEADLPDPTEARMAALETWDENAARIWAEWNALPPTLHTAAPGHGRYAAAPLRQHFELGAPNRVGLRPVHLDNRRRR